MIYTKRQHLARYLGQCESLDTAIRHLLSTDLAQLSKGRNEIDGDQVFVNRFDYQTMPPEQAIWRSEERICTSFCPVTKKSVSPTRRR